MLFLNSLSLLYEINRGLLRQEFELYYQPIIDLKADKVVGFEALVRWNHPKVGLIMPDGFIPNVEQFDFLAVWFSKYILNKAAQQAAEWKNKNEFYVAVNVPASHITKSNFAKYFTDIVDTYGLSSSDIVIELTETVYSDFPPVIRNLAVLKQNQTKVLLDDFLTGFSSFEKLLRLGGYLSGVKVSQLFAVNLVENEDIVKLLTEVAHTRHLMVVAEGIETQAQLDVIKRLGIDCAQGWIWSKALTVDKAWHWAKEYNSKP